MPSEISLLKQRTIKILNTFAKLYPTSDIFKNVDIEAIKSFKEDAQSGFDELYLKCQFFQYLAKNLSFTSFNTLPFRGKYLVEMVFNSFLEGELIELNNNKSLTDLLYKFNYLDNSLNDFGFWRYADAQTFIDLSNSMAEYVRWYERNSRFLYCSNNYPVISPDLDKKISSMDDKDDADEGDERHLRLGKDQCIGTRGLGYCVALIGIRPTTNPEVEVLHISSSVEENLEDLCNRFKDRDNNTYSRKCIGIYLIGGRPIHFADFLPTIYNDEFNILDVRLATSINVPQVGCIVTSNGEDASVYYSGSLAHTPANKRKLTDEIKGEEKESSEKRPKFR